MVPRGLEPRTLRLLAVRSNQLSYETSWEQFSKDAREELTGVEISCAGSCAAVWLQPWRRKGERPPAQQQCLDASAATKRHRGDSNPCGQSPMDFESISLAARTQCHVMDHFLVGLIKQSLKCSGLLGSVNCKPLAALSLNFVLSLALPTCRRDATFRKSAASEDRTHDLRIMRPTRCQLHYSRIWLCP